MSRKLILNDYIGMKYHRLTIVEYVGTIKTRHIFKCLCDCGAVKNVSLNHLKSGETKSCGCLSREANKVSNAKRNLNTYIIKKEICTCTTNNGDSFIFDSDDLGIVKNICWRIDYHGYVIGCVNGKTKQLHRLILNAPKDKIVDHINGDKTDNRKSNLRLCTYKENNMNKKKYERDLPTGISYDQRNNTYYARIGYKYKKIHLLSSKNLDECIKARKEAEKKYFGEFARMEKRNEFC